VGGSSTGCLMSRGRGR